MVVAAEASNDNLLKKKNAHIRQSRTDVGHQPVFKPFSQHCATRTRGINSQAANRSTDRTGETIVVGMLIGSQIAEGHIVEGRILDLACQLISGQQLSLGSR
jgi:hypothetical protein